MTRPVPAVVAHRGASDAVPEHTLASYRQALDEGADALECDVRLTRDGVPVCVHDPRVNRTSNGSGWVSGLELADLAELDFGCRHPNAGEEAPDRDHSGVLTLERLLEFVTAAPRPVDLAVETKHPSRYGGLVERSVVALLRRFGLTRPRPGRGSARLMSFSLLGLRRALLLAPELPAVLLLPRIAVRVAPGALPAGVRAVGPNVELVRRHPAYVERLHAGGVAVHVWTVDEPADVDLCLDLGVDAIITNRPQQVRRRLADARRA